MSRKLSFNSTREMSIKNKKILFWICGIGKGHIYRQLPIIEHFFALWYTIGIFWFGESYRFFIAYFKKTPEIKVIEVSVPWICGTYNGIDYKKTAYLSNNKYNFIKKNYIAMGEMYDFLGVPNLVISDYEPTAAQYAYMHGATFITIDQQSKYFIIRDSIEVHQRSWLEEVSRLSLFFPFANERLVTSFFSLDTKLGFHFDKEVKIFPPILRKEISLLNKKIIKNNKKIIVYISSYSDFVQPMEEIVKIFSQFEDVEFCMYLPKGNSLLHAVWVYTNIVIREHGNNTYLPDLMSSIWAISTAGHSFISELMSLWIPSYLIPLETYEQHDSASVIHKHWFGISGEKITYEWLKHFLQNIKTYQQNITANTKGILMAGDGLNLILSYITKKYLS